MPGPDFPLITIRDPSDSEIGDILSTIVRNALDGLYQSSAVVPACEFTVEFRGANLSSDEPNEVVAKIAEAILQIESRPTPIRIQLEKGQVQLRREKATRVRSTSTAPSGKVIEASMPKKGISRRPHEETEQSHLVEQNRLLLEQNQLLKEQVELQREEIGRLRAQQEVTHLKLAKLLGPDLSALPTDQREVAEAIHALPGENFADANNLINKLTGQPMTAQFSRALSAILREKKWGLICPSCGKSSSLTWHPGRGYAQGGRTYFSHSSGSGQASRHCSLTTIRDLQFGPRADGRKSRISKQK